MDFHVNLIAQTTTQSNGLLSPMAIVALCVLAAVGIGLLLPSKRAATPRRIGGALAAVSGLIFAILLLRTGQHAGWGGEVGLYFWAFSTITLLSAVRVITHPKPVYSALYFVLTVFASAGLFVLLWAEFMAAALVLIYAGAVLVTYVFVIMLAAESTGGIGSAANVGDADKISRDPFLAGATGFTLLGILLLVAFDSTSIPKVEFNPQSEAASVQSGAFRDAPNVSGDTQQLGAFLYQQQMLPVQVAMLILTLAMTGAVIIARRKVYIPELPPTAKPTPTNFDLTCPATPRDDDPHSIPVYGTSDPKAKQYPQT